MKPREESISRKADIILRLYGWKKELLSNKRRVMDQKGCSTHWPSVCMTNNEVPLK